LGKSQPGIVIRGKLITFVLSAQVRRCLQHLDKEEDNVRKNLYLQVYVCVNACICVLCTCACVRARVDTLLCVCVSVCTREKRNAHISDNIVA